MEKSKIFVLICFYLEINLAHMLKWNTLIDNEIQSDDRSLTTVAKPRDLIIFIVGGSRKLATRNRVRNLDKHALEPYKSLKKLDPKYELGDFEARSKIIVKDKKQTDDKQDDEFDESPDDVLDELSLTDEQKQMLRRRWNSSCDKRAARYCKRACRNTYRDVCRAYRCHRAMKRSFKRDCRRNCNTKFLHRW